PTRSPLAVSTSMSVIALGPPQDAGLVIEPDMEVLTANGERVGRVKEVIVGDAFLIDRPLRRDIWVPLSAVAAVADGRVKLSAADVGDVTLDAPPYTDAQLDGDNP